MTMQHTADQIFRCFQWLLAILLATSCLAVAGSAQTTGELEEQAFQQAVAAADPSIVRIETVGGRDLVGEVLTATGPTTGVIVSADGDIITSRFNFISRPASIVVTLADERKLPAVVVAEDEARMLTLLKVEATNLAPLAAADPASIQVGSWALALGRTFELGFPNLSVGIVSAVKRLNGRAIQTDAKVSPLNYGGPLIDLSGRGLGILVPLSPQQTDETAGVEWYDGGIGFAIPLADVYRVLPRLKSGQTLKRGLMGIQFADDGPLAGEPKVVSVRPESPADKAGILPDDIITAVDGEHVARIPLLKRAMGPRYAGDIVKLTLKRGDQTQEVNLELAAELKAYEVPALGILPLRSSADAESAGVVIRQLKPGGPCEVAGLQVGDTIQAIADKPITTLDSLQSALRAYSVDDACPITYVRAGQSAQAELKLGSLNSEIPADLEPVKWPAVNPPAGDLGRHSETLPGRELKYWTYMPETYNPSHPLGLLLWLHPAGDTMEAELLRLCQAECDARGILLVGPQAGDVAGWNADDVEAIIELVGKLQESYRIDPHRIAICAHDDAVPFGFQVAFKKRELFRGVIASSGVSRRRLPDNDPDFRMQILLTAFDQDQNTPLLQKFAEVIGTMKYPIGQQVFPGAAQGGLTAEWAKSILIWVDALDRI